MESEGRLSHNRPSRRRDRQRNNFSESLSLSNSLLDIFCPIGTEQQEHLRFRTTFSDSISKRTALLSTRKPRHFSDLCYGANTSCTVSSKQSICMAIRYPNHYPNPTTSKKDMLSLAFLQGGSLIYIPTSEQPFARQRQRLYRTTQRTALAQHQHQHQA